METYYVRRNRGKEIILLLLMIIMISVGLYLWITQNTSNGYILYLALTSIPIPFIFMLTYKLIQNKPRLIFSEKGIYMQKLNRTIPWHNISHIDVLEKEFEEESGDEIRIQRQYFFSIFEITEQKVDGEYGFTRELNVGETALDHKELKAIAMKYKQHYKN